MRELKGQVDDLWAQKKESTKDHREANDRYYKKIAEERARQQEGMPPNELRRSWKNEERLRNVYEKRRPYPRSKPKLKIPKHSSMLSRPRSG